jgi:hypothetical protein
MRKILTILFLLIGSILLSPTAVNAANIHICDTAVCGQTPGDGSTWSNALDDFPATFVRDNTYWIADGSYGGINMTSANALEDGVKVITIKKATAGEGNHGSDTGWDNAYGDGQAIFQQPDNFDNVYRKYVFLIRVSYITIDGVVGSGSDPDTYGFKFLQHPSYGDDDNPSSYQTGYEIIGVGSTLGRKLLLSNIKILHSAVVGTGDENCSDGTPYTCTTDCIRVYVSPSEGGSLTNLEIGDTYTYGCVNNINVSGITDAVIHDNYLNDNVSDAVGPHGQNMNLDTDTRPLVYNNTFVNSETFVIALHNNNLGVITGAKIYNNLIIGGETLTGCISTMSSTTSAVMYSSYAHHNTVVGTDCGAGRGFFHVGNLSDVDTQKSFAYNNLFYNSANVRLDNYGRTANAITHDNNAYMACTGTLNNADETAPQVDADAPTTIFTNYAGGVYAINAANQFAIDHIIGKGTTLASPFDIDYSGVSRTAPFDIGAYDVGGSSDETAPILTEVTAMPPFGTNQAVQYTFSTTEAGTVTYSGTCGTGSLSTAILGENTTEWNLGVGTYSNCSITVTDAALNASDPLLISEFTIRPETGVMPMAIKGGAVFLRLP